MPKAKKTNEELAGYTERLSKFIRIQNLSVIFDDSSPVGGAKPSGNSFWVKFSNVFFTPDKKI
ncbi:MAG: hypothetical protein IKL57_08605 [Oscillospiraceae bacterium]|nr:hypothetical protein [Oscillospiraceae bacterium]